MSKFSAVSLFFSPADANIFQNIGMQVFITDYFFKSNLAEDFSCAEIMVSINILLNYALYLML